MPQPSGLPCEGVPEPAGSVCGHDDHKRRSITRRYRPTRFARG
jgi:hypothetical protein